MNKNGKIYYIEEIFVKIRFRYLSINSKITVLETQHFPDFFYTCLKLEHELKSLFTCILTMFFNKI